MKARLRIGRAARCRAYTRDAKSGSFGRRRTDEPIDDLRRDALLAEARLPQALTATFLYVQRPVMFIDAFESGVSPAQRHFRKRATDHNRQH